MDLHGFVGRNVQYWFKAFLQLRLAWLAWQYSTFVGMGLLYSHDIPNYTNRDRFFDPNEIRSTTIMQDWGIHKKNMEIIWINTRLVKSSCGKLCIFAEQCEDKFEWNQVTGEVNVWRVSKRPWTSFNNLWSRMRLPSLGRMHFRDGWSLFCCEKMVIKTVELWFRHGFPRSHNICSRNRDGLDSVLTCWNALHLSGPSSLVGWVAPLCWIASAFPRGKTSWAKGPVQGDCLGLLASTVSC